MAPAGLNTHSSPAAREDVAISDGSGIKHDADPLIILDDGDDNANDHEAQQRTKVVVDETQYVEMEPVTQWQEHPSHCVEETQFEDMVLDSQAPPDDIAYPHHSGVVMSMGHATPQTVPAEKPTPFSRAPNSSPMGKANKDFKWAKNVNHTMAAKDFSHGRRPPSGHSVAHNVGNAPTSHPCEAAIPRLELAEATAAHIQPEVASSVADTFSSKLGSTDIFMPSPNVGPDNDTLQHPKLELNPNVEHTSADPPGDGKHQISTRAIAHSSINLLRTRDVTSNQKQVQHGECSPAGAVVVLSKNHVVLSGVNEQIPLQANMKSDDHPANPTPMAQRESIMSIKSTRPVRVVSATNSSRRPRQQKHNIKNPIRTKVFQQQVITDRELSKQLSDTNLQFFPNGRPNTDLPFSTAVATCPFPDQVASSANSSLDRDRYNQRLHRNVDSLESTACINESCLSELETVVDHGPSTNQHLSMSLDENVKLQLVLGASDRSENNPGQSTTTFDVREQVNTHKEPVVTHAHDTVSLPITVHTQENLPDFQVEHRSASGILCVKTSDDPTWKDGQQAGLVEVSSTTTSVDQQDPSSRAGTHLQNNFTPVNSGVAKVENESDSSHVPAECAATSSNHGLGANNEIEVNQDPMRKTSSRPIRAGDLVPSHIQQALEVQQPAKVKKGARNGTTVVPIKCPDNACGADLNALLEPYFHHKLVKPIVADRNRQLAELHANQTQLQEHIQKVESERDGYKETCEKVTAEAEAWKAKAGRLKDKAATYVAHANELTRSESYLRGALYKMKEEVTSLKNCKEQIYQDTSNALITYNQVNAVVIQCEALTNDVMAVNNELVVHGESLEETLRDETIKNEDLEERMKQANATKSDMAKALKDMPGTFADERKKKDGMVDQLLASNARIQSKYDELTWLMTGIKDLTKEFSPMLTKSFEGFMTSVESRISTSPEKDETELASGLLGQLKEHLDQKFLKQAIHDSLLSQLSSVRMENEEISQEKLLQGTQIGELQQQTDQLTLELEKIKIDTACKDTELIILRARPGKENRLREQLEVLETTDVDLQRQLAEALEKIAAMDTMVADFEEHYKQVISVVGSSLCEQHKVEKDEWKVQLNSLEEASKQANDGYTLSIRQLESEKTNLVRKREEAEQKEAILRDQLKAAQEVTKTLRTDLGQANEHIKQKYSYLLEIEQQSVKKEALDQLCHEVERNREAGANLRSRSDALELECQKLMQELKRPVAEQSLNGAGTLRWTPRDTHRSAQRVAQNYDVVAERRQSHAIANSPVSRISRDHSGRLEDTRPIPGTPSSELSETFVDAEDLTDVNTPDDEKVEGHYQERLKRHSQTSNTKTYHNSSTRSKTVISTQLSTTNIVTMRTTPNVQREDSRRREENLPLKSALKSVTFSEPAISNRSIQLQVDRPDQVHDSPSHGLKPTRGRDRTYSRTRTRNTATGEAAGFPANNTIHRNSAPQTEYRSMNSGPKRSHQHDDVSTSKRLRSGRSDRRSVIPDSQESYVPPL